MINRLLLSRIAACALALPVLADWDLGDPYKWRQLPQMGPGGYNVLSSQAIYPGGGLVNKLVADDWQCNDPRPVTDIHIWGSWWDDNPQPNWPGLFSLSIYSDTPAGPNPGEHSRPGAELWTRVLTPSIRPWGDAVGEQFYDPNKVLNPPTGLSPEQKVWQYNFLLNPADYFQQQPGKIYWLSVQALGITDTGHYWGWKTSMDHWNDDATWADMPIAGPQDWNELRDPLDPSKSLDMAFVLTVPEPSTYALLAGLGLVGFAAYRRLRR
jgi:hypothetical protein